MTVIHEMQQHLVVDTPFGKAQVLLIIDYGIHANTIWVCSNYSNGKIRHFGSNQISVETNHTLMFNKTQNNGREKRGKSKKAKRKIT